MSQDYLHACERAELLGLPVPTEEEWRLSEEAQAQNHVNADEDDEILQNLDTSDEAARRITGGLDELNSILSVTQKKLNRFKTVCGSLSGLLKVKVGSRNNTPNHKPSERNPSDSQESGEEAPAQDENLTVELTEDERKDGNAEGNHPATPKKIDLNEKMGSHLDKLDSLIAKAETAQYSMQHQNKQMRKFLK